MIPFITTQSRPLIDETNPSFSEAQTYQSLLHSVNCVSTQLKYTTIVQHVRTTYRTTTSGNSFTE